MNKQEDNLLAKWLEGSITKKEREVLHQQVDLTALREVLDRQQQLDVEVVAADDMWTTFEQQQFPKDSGAADTPSKPIAQNRRTWLVALVLILLSLLIGWFFLSRQGNKKIETLPGEQQEQIFADGTKVQISPGSVLRYESDWSTARRLNLQGQAYFDVTKGQPFEVKTPIGKIEVLGTEFDIWQSGNYLRVQCFEGSVRVSVDEQKSLVLKKGEAVHFRNGGNLDRSTVSGPDNYRGQADWLDAKRNYKKIAIQEVLADITRFYGVEVKAEGKNLQTDFTGVIPTDDLQKAAVYLSETMGWGFDLEEGRLTFY